MLLGGLWHGANWTFVAWGAFHGIMLALERASPSRNLLARAPVAVQRGFTFLLVIAGWVLFRSDSIGDAMQYFQGLVGLRGMGWSWYAGQGAQLSLGLLAACGAIAWLLPNSWEIRWKHNVFEALVFAVLFVVCVGIMLVNASSPFLYFQF
jgi:alginate O-acetyltransferase complex protein AlgI